MEQQQDQSIGVSKSPGIWNDARTAIRANFLPGILLWVVAAGVVLLYYFSADARPFFTQLSQWKADGGFAFSIVSTGIFAGVIPFIFMLSMKSTRQNATISTLVFTTLFWAYRGFEVDLFYRLQGLMFGMVPTFTTVAIKVAVDLLVYNVVWAMSLQLLAYYWKSEGFRFSAFKCYSWRNHFTRHLPAGLLSVWAIWLPVLIFVYSLPSDLQIPLFNIAVCFWALVMATLAKPKPQG